MSGSDPAISTMLEQLRTRLINQEMERERKRKRRNDAIWILAIIIAACIASAIEHWGWK